MTEMTPERAREFGNAWNSGDSALVASFGFRRPGHVRVGLRDRRGRRDDGEAAGCDLLEFRGGEVTVKNAFRKVAA
jgi:hypothetical protein